MWCTDATLVDACFVKVGREFRLGVAIAEFVVFFELHLLGRLSCVRKNMMTSFGNTCHARDSLLTRGGESLAFFHE